jgi:osmotically-inducible protein OsmY
MKKTLHTQKLASLMALMGVLAVGGFASGCAATPTRDSTGQYIDDTGITAKVKTALLKDKEVKSFEIKVETMKGVVQLSGFVDTAAQKAAAAQDAAAVPGVTDVKNSLIVK